MEGCSGCLSCRSCSRTLGSGCLPADAKWDDLVRSRSPAILTQIPCILTAVAAITAPVAKILAQIALVLTAVADVLATLLASVVMPDLARVLPQRPTILPDLMVVAAKLAGVAMNLTPVRAKLVRFARRHSRVTRNVWMFDSLCAHEGRTSNEQGRSNGRHSEIAHHIPQRRCPALAVVACAARTTVALWRTLRANPAGRRCGNFFPFFIPALSEISLALRRRYTRAS